MNKGIIKNIKRLYICNLFSIFLALMPDFSNDPDKCHLCRVGSTWLSTIFKKLLLTEKYVFCYHWLFVRIKHLCVEQAIYITNAKKIFWT